MYGKSIGDTEAFQKVKSNWLYHQRQKHCYIQVALILQEPVDISPGTELLTTPSAEKAESALTEGEWGCTLHLDLLKFQYPLQRMGPSPLPLGSFASAASSPDRVLGLGKCSSADPAVGWRRDSTSKPQFGLIFKDHERKWCTKTMKNSHIPLGLYSYFSS